MILNVETTYYNLLYQREQYKVQEEELKQAQQLLDENTIKRQTGALTDLDVMNARAGVASAQNQLILDEQAVHNSEDSLLQLLGDRQFRTTVGDDRLSRTSASPMCPLSVPTSWRATTDPIWRSRRRRSTSSSSTALKAKRNTLPLLNVNGGLAYDSYASTAGAVGDRQLERLQLDRRPHA